MEFIAPDGLAVLGRGEGGEASPGPGLASLVDELAHGMVVTRADGRVLHANQAARQELARERVLAVRQQRLHAMEPASQDDLNQALARAVDGKRSLVDLRAGESVPLLVAAVPLKSAHPSHVPHVALLFARSAVCDSLMLCFFARRHGLTPTEEQVLGILCEGYSAPQAAAQLKVAVSTVRSHVRSVCAKTRASGVRDLVTRLAVLPPVAPAFWREPVH